MSHQTNFFDDVSNHAGIAGTSADRGDRFQIIFYTKPFRPNHRVTLRNNIDGWQRDVFGAYAYGAWIFELEKSNYPGKLEFKFVLDDKYWMNGLNRHVSNDITHKFTDSPADHADVINPVVIFSGVDYRFTHGYDNLLTEESTFQQDRFPGNRDESVMYDVIVIGSGIGGGILADNLSDAGVKTLVLEVGSLKSETHMSNVFADWAEITMEDQVGHYQKTPGTEFLFGAQMALGGRSNYWSGIILRMQDWELAYWPSAIQQFLTDEGGKGYRQAEQLMRKRQTLGHYQEQVVGQLKQKMPDVRIEDLPRSRHQPNLNQNNMIDSVLFSSTGVFSTADLLSDSKAFVGSRGYNDLTVNLNHMVTDIRVDPQHPQRVKSVVCEDLICHCTREYQAKNIVLAAGSLESPKIFLQSGLNDPSAKAGIGLTDHPYLFSKRYFIPRNNPLWGDDKHAKLLLAAGNASKNHYPFYAEMLINPWYWQVRRSDDDLWETPPDDQKITEISMKFGFGTELVDNNWIQNIARGEKVLLNVANNTIPQQHQDQAHEFRNRILDAMGIILSSEEKNERMGLAAHGGTVNHSGGTLRIGQPGQGVVDENLKFHAYENFYAADVSVYPYIPTANPVLTLGGLSLRLADHLKNILL